MFDPDWTCSPNKERRVTVICLAEIKAFWETFTVK